MDNSEDEMEEDDTEWKTSFVDSLPSSPASCTGNIELSFWLSGALARIELHASDW